MVRIYARRAHAPAASWERHGRPRTQALAAARQWSRRVVSRPGAVLFVAEYRQVKVRIGRVTRGEPSFVLDPIWLDET